MVTGRRTLILRRLLTLSLVSPCECTFNPLLCTYLYHVLSASWYKPGQTPGSVLGEVSSSLEEMRAEVVALYRASFHLSSNENSLTATSYSGRQQKDSRDFQGSSRGAGGEPYLVLTSLLSIPPRKTSRMCNTSCSSLWSALVINLSGS